MERQKYAKYLKTAFRETFDGCDDTECTVDEFCKELAAYSVSGNWFEIKLKVIIR